MNALHLKLKLWKAKINTILFAFQQLSNNNKIIKNYATLFFYLTKEFEYKFQSFRKNNKIFESLLLHLQVIYMHEASEFSNGIEQ